MLRHEQDPRPPCPDGWVEVDEAGRPVRPETYSDDWRRLVKDAGLPARRLHDARHTSVSIMLKAGIPVTEVARWHGHSVATMLAVYAHSPEGTGSSASAALRGALDEARAKIM